MSTPLSTDLVAELRVLGHSGVGERAALQGADLIETFARYIVRHCNYKRLDDHACARCVGAGGELVKADFVCAFHKAEDVLSALDRTQEKSDGR